jgi:hypothetical protein
MVRDAYANYVVQTAIDVVPEGNEKRMLLEELKAHEVQLVSGVVSSFRVMSIDCSRSSSLIIIFGLALSNRQTTAKLHLRQAYCCEAWHKVMSLALSQSI